MPGQCMSMLLFLAVSAGIGDVVVYEGDALPEEQGWERIGTLDGTRWVQAGQLFQNVDLGVWPGPYGENDLYRKYLSDQLNDQNWFVEWRMMTDGSRDAIDNGIVAPAAFVLGGNTSVHYHFTIARDLVRLYRDNFVTIHYVDIAPWVPHTYRVEHYGSNQYIWYIDGQIIIQEAPGGAYPTDISHLVLFGTRCWNTENTTQWDYIQFGTLPTANSGDFNSDGIIDEIDQHYFVDCLLGAGATWQGCRWADMNNDGIADGRDTNVFLHAMLNQ